MDLNMEGAASTLCGIQIGFREDLVVSFAHLYKQGSTLEEH